MAGGAAFGLACSAICPLEVRCAHLGPAHPAPAVGPDSGLIEPNARAAASSGSSARPCRSFKSTRTPMRSPTPSSVRGGILRTRKGLYSQLLPPSRDGSLSTRTVAPRPICCRLRASKSTMARQMLRIHLGCRKRSRVVTVYLSKSTERKFAAVSGCHRDCHTRESCLYDVTSDSVTKGENRE